MTGLVLAVVTLTNVWGSVAVDPVRSPQTQKMICWNCGKDPKAEYATGEWRRFLCLEPASNVAADAIMLQPGEAAAVDIQIEVTNL